MLFYFEIVVARPHSALGSLRNGPRQYERTNERTSVPHPSVVQAEESAAAIKGSYVFNRVFDDSYTQLDVYEASCRPYVADFLGGTNVTIFAYGQTGTGKTHTISGPSEDPLGACMRAAPRCALCGVCADSTPPGTRSEKSHERKSRRAGRNPSLARAVRKLKMTFSAPGP